MNQAPNIYDSYQLTKLCHTIIFLYKSLLLRVC